jgi:hypothetical protein
MKDNRIDTRKLLLTSDCMNVGGYSVPRARTWISNVICRGLFLYERCLIVLLILVELMSITV